MIFSARKRQLLLPEEDVGERGSALTHLGNAPDQAASGKSCKNVVHVEMIERRLAIVPDLACQVLEKQLPSGPLACPLVAFPLPHSLQANPFQNTKLYLISNTIYIYLLMSSEGHSTVSHVPPCD